MKTQIVLILVCLIHFSCNHSNKIKLEKDAMVQSVFSKEEIKDLNKILDFFDAEICEVEGYGIIKNYETCYHNYLEKIKKEVKTFGLRAKIPIAHQEKLMNEIDPDLRKEIWYDREEKVVVRVSDSRTDTLMKDLQTIGMNMNGKFMTLLKKMEQEDKKVKLYLEDIRKAGDFSPSVTFGDMVANYKDYNLDDERIRLFLAVHFLYLNYDDYKRGDLYN